MTCLPAGRPNGQVLGSSFDGALLWCFGGDVFTHDRELIDTLFHYRIFVVWFGDPTPEQARCGVDGWWEKEKDPVSGGTEMLKRGLLSPGGLGPLAENVAYAFLGHDVAKCLRDFRWTGPPCCSDPPYHRPRLRAEV